MSVAVQARQMDAEADAAARAAYQQESEAAAKPVVKEDPSPTNPDGTPTPAGWRLIGKTFRKPLSAKTRTGRGNQTFSYITARQVQDVLDSVGPGNWASEVKVVRAEHPVAVLVGIGVFGVWKWDAGYSNNPDADEETDRAYELEPLKAAVSDGFKRAAVQWGIGRFLYGD